MPALDLKTGKKVCATCRRGLLAQDFSKSLGRPDGLKYSCRGCCKSRSAKYYIENKSRINSRNRDWYTDNLEFRKASLRKWRLANPGIMAAAVKRWNKANPDKGRAWAKSHPDKINEYCKKWRDNNPGKISELNRISNSRRRSIGIFSSKDWDLLLYVCGRRCVKCGIHESESKPNTFRKRARLEADHILPVVLGGTSHISNIQPLCPKCNTTKRAKYGDYRPLRAVLIFGKSQQPA